MFPGLQAVKKEGKKFHTITAYHGNKHLKNLKEILKNLVECFHENGEIIIEVPNSDDALLTLYDSNDFQNFTYRSQHLFLFNAQTLTQLFEQTGLRVNRFKHIQSYPLSNYLLLAS